METVEIPLQIAQKAMRFFRPLAPYVRKRIAELRNERKAVEEIPEPIIVEPIAEEAKPKRTKKEKK